MSTVSPLYSGSSPTTITYTSLASLPTSATFVAGAECTQIDNTSTKYRRAYVQLFIKVGTTPVVNTFINAYFWSSQVSLATTALDTLDGTDSAETITSVGILGAMLRLGGQAQVDATSDRVYQFALIDVGWVLRLDDLPPWWGIYVAHNTGVNLNASGSSATFMGIGSTIA